MSTTHKVPWEKVFSAQVLLPVPAQFSRDSRASPVIRARIFLKIPQLASAVVRLNTVTFCCCLVFETDAPAYHLFLVSGNR